METTARSRAPLGVMGAGWVGLTTAACFAALGHRVLVRDVDPFRIANLRAGRLPIVEPELPELFAENRDRIEFTLDADVVIRECDIIFVCVGTPATYSGDADLSAVWHLVSEIRRGSTATTLVMKSTVPVGTGAKVRRELDARGLKRVRYVSNPEFLAEGTAVQDFMHPARVVVGSFDDSDGAAVAALYERLGAPVLQMDVASAEMAKYASNAFLATKISFINEIANVCEETGADVAVVAEAMGLDDRIGPRFLGAGIGYGGSCFPKDVTALKQLAGNSGYHFELLNAVIEVNDLQKRRLLAKLKGALGDLRDQRIAVLGLAFKPGTNDVRESASLVLAGRLVAEGARVRAWDPVANEAARPLLPSDVELVDDPIQAVRGADAAVIATEWPELRLLPLARVKRLMRNPLIVDGRNFLDRERVCRAGLSYIGVGRPSAVAEEREAVAPARRAPAVRRLAAVPQTPAG